MIKIHDIRVGNYVQFINRDGQTQIDQIASIIHDGSLWTNKFDQRHDEEDLSGVDITESRLIKLGFLLKDKESKLRTFYMDGYEVSLYNGDWYFSLPKSSIIVAVINFIHQLQNLMYHLANKYLIFQNND